MGALGVDSNQLFEVGVNIGLSGTFEAIEPAFTDFMNEAFRVQQESFDGDGGMHVVGVQMLLGYEEGQFTVDDLWMPLM